MKVGIVGAGLIGQKRAEAAKKAGLNIAMIADINLESAQKLANTYNAKAVSDYKELTNSKEINIVVICAIHNVLAEITIDAINNKKHVLVEKPAAINSAEFNKIKEAMKNNPEVKVKVGYNHRFHPMIKKAKQMVNEGKIGEPIFIRARYGHGGRIGYEKEWRANKELSGGGELLDQGSHIIDLSRWFLGDFNEVKGFCETYFWDMKVEDNAFALLKTKEGKIASLHASWTQWKNLFSFEIAGKTGLITIDGLGKSYGKETLTYYKEPAELGPPITTKEEYDEDDTTWEEEFQNLNEAIKNNTQPNGTINDAAEVMRIIEKLYGENK